MPREHPAFTSLPVLASSTGAIFLGNSMALDDYTRAELRRSALGYVQRKEADNDVPVRIAELRANIARIEGRDGKAAETREENEYELDQLLKLATALDVPTELDVDPEPAAPE